MTKFADIPFSDGPHKLSSGILSIKRHDNLISEKEFQLKYEDLTDEELKTKRVFFEVDINIYNMEGDATAYFLLPRVADSHIQKILANREKTKNSTPIFDKLSSKLPKAIVDPADSEIQTCTKNTELPQINNNGFIGRISGLLKNLASVLDKKYFTHNSLLFLSRRKATVSV